jgi:hypothetical protein
MFGFFVNAQSDRFQDGVNIPSNMKQGRHARESGHPEVLNSEVCVSREIQAWIPAYAGMTPR